MKLPQNIHERTNIHLKIVGKWNENFVKTQVNIPAEIKALAHHIVSHPTKL